MKDKTIDSDKRGEGFLKGVHLSIVFSILKGLILGYT